VAAREPDRSRDLQEVALMMIDGTESTVSCIAHMARARWTI
jgi:hypothetical protein